MSQVILEVWEVRRRSWRRILEDVSGNFGGLRGGGGGPCDDENKGRAGQAHA